MLFNIVQEESICVYNTALSVEILNKFPSLIKFTGISNAFQNLLKLHYSPKNVSVSEFMARNRDL